MNARTPFADPVELIAIDLDRVVAAAERAQRRIAPLFPLTSFVAVNPFLGLSQYRLHEAAEVLARTAGARVTMQRAYYLDAIADGRIARSDIAAALGEFPKNDALPRDVDGFLRLAKDGETALPAPLATVADVASRWSGLDLARLTVERISDFAATHLDEGEAVWRPESRTGRLYEAWRQSATVDLAPELAGLKGYRRMVAAMPETAEAMLQEGVSRLGLPAARLEEQFHRLLMTVGGWAGYARYRLWQAELRGGCDPTLRDLLAIRLASDVVLFEIFKGRPGFVEAWERALAASAHPDPAARLGLAADAVLQRAAELAWLRGLIARFPASSEAERPNRPSVQAVFCIDVRSEPFRRALESVSTGTETMGFAGFFGIPLDYVASGETEGVAHCPVLLEPKFRVIASEQNREAGRAALADRRRMGRAMSAAWAGFRQRAISSFAFVEALGVGYAAKIVASLLGAPNATRGLEEPAPRIDPQRDEVGESGFQPATRLELAEAVLKAMSLTSGFARLVLLVGHGSTTVNNPHASGLDCGACGGHTGEASARVAAAILNDPDVREGLMRRGIAIPPDTRFVACLHDTTTDRVRIFDRQAVPGSHASDLEAIELALDRAGRLARTERSALLNLDRNRPTDRQILARARDWSQVRPEWGLAGCAAFIAASRHRTLGVDLGGRAFLHSYAWRQDEGFRTLELIMTAPMVVASWICLQYYGSTVDNRTFGSGNKVLHNVVGKLGVVEGNGGDLRVGLPWQSVHDGERLIHEPLRLAVVIEAPVEAISAVIDRHAMVRELVENGWLSLHAMDECGRIAWRCAGGLRWVPVEGAERRADAA